MGDEESGSILGGAEEMLGAAWDATKNVAEAGFDTALNVGETLGAGAVQIAAGAAYAFDAQDTAASLHQTAEGMAGDILHREYEAQSDLKQAWEDIVGSDEEGTKSEPDPVYLVPEE
jgi:hypothetical protein